jgi:uncharacterized protein (TIGR02996 family)
MPTAEQLALWAAIRANPLDDTPRLVYADWLHENGDEPRAEFIRVQCALAALGPDRRKGRKQRPALEARERGLLAVHGERWLAPFRGALKGSRRFDREDRWLTRLTLRRGFADLSSLELEPCCRIAEADDNLEPVGPCYVTDCKAEYAHGRVVTIARWKGAGCLTGLSVGGAGNRDVTEIVRSAYLRNLTHLGLWYGEVNDKGVTELAAWTAAAGLRYVNLQDNPITDAGALVLVESPHLTNLHRLDLYRTRIGTTGRQLLHERFEQALAIESEPE